MKVIVDKLLCETNGICVRECPDMFALENEINVVVKFETVPESIADDVRRAVSACPRQALSISEPDSD